ncbi:hypothetical protein [Halogeometricum limi]|uniref:Uncharacterized protein n=1 Tax=Halogeometricum limi TaxID=555875 RepID=A0A1I6G1I3_9EURY|nr:hypothetical protein [Halogeometricum limi]SFR36045.1 hypothetical protein SAMN04488124_0716 [Halogeometricum limi]
MLRRRLLSSLAGLTSVAGLSALSGCSALAPGASTPRPTASFSLRWVPDESVYRVRFEEGETLTAANTGELHVASPGTDTLWAGGEDAVASFPLEPGATVRHAVSDRSVVRVVWVSPSGNDSATLAQWRPDSQRTATP